MFSPAVANNNDLQVGTSLDVKHVRRWAIILRLVKTLRMVLWICVSRRDLHDYLPPSVLPKKVKRVIPQVVFWYVCHS